MKKRLLVLPATILLGGLAYGAAAPAVVLIQASGVVHAGHETARAKKRDSVRWGPDAGATSWYVIFPGASPCDGGAKEFGSEPNLPKTCNLQNATPGTYKYSTSDRKAGTKHDPVVIIDPS